MALRGSLELLPAEDRARIGIAKLVAPGTASLGVLDFHTSHLHHQHAYGEGDRRHLQGKTKSRECGIPSSRRASGMVLHSNPLRTFCASHGSMGSSNRQIGVYMAKYIQMDAQPPKCSSTLALSRFHWGLTPTGQSRGKTPRQHHHRLIFLQADKFKHTHHQKAQSSPEQHHQAGQVAVRLLFSASFYSSSFPGGWQFPQPYPHLSTAKETPNRQHRKEAPGYLVLLPNDFPCR